MHYETCRNLWSRTAAVLWPAGDVAHRQPRLRLILGGALVLSLGILFFPSNFSVFSFLAGSERETTVPVLVAKRYLPAFSVIHSEGVDVHRYPASFVPPGALNSLSELKSDTGQNVYASVVAIPQGQPLTRTILIDAAEKQRMASLIAPGQVAVSFAVDKAHAAGGWVRPGDRVAIFQTEDPQKVTRLLFGALHVLAVDNARLGQGGPDEQDSEKGPLVVEPSAEDTANRILTVLATPNEAAHLLDARERGSLSVVLRALGDDIPWLTAK
jgi:Flp pilus assembly protein CpaB